MDDELVRHKRAETDNNNRKIEDEIENIYANPKMAPFASTLASNLGFHRNTVNGSRNWHLTRPLRIGDEYLTAGRQVSLKDLLDIVKEQRLKKRTRRSKSQIRRVEDITEELGGLEEFLENMKADNADLKHDNDDLKIQSKEKERVHEITVFRLDNLNAENIDLKCRIKELESVIEKRRYKPSQKGAVSILKT